MTFNNYLILTYNIVMVKPNFLIIGAQKAGSTTLTKYLMQHPDIFISNPKEPVFFANDTLYNKGLEFYQKFFVERKNESRIGDASTAYSQYVDLKKVISRIHDFDPNMKIIYILRNPIERAHSAYWHNVRDMVEKLSVEQALEIEESRTNNTFRIDPFSYKRRGLYYFIINSYLKFFPRKNFHVLLLEDLETFPETTCNNIFKFLKIKEFNVTPIPKENFSVLPKNKIIYKLINHPNKATRFMFNLFGNRFKKKLRVKLDTLNRKNLEEFTYPLMNVQTENYLIKYFEKDTLELEKFLGRKLSHWRTKTIGKIANKIDE